MYFTTKSDSFNIFIYISMGWRLRVCSLMRWSLGSRRELLSRFKRLIMIAYTILKEQKSPVAENCHFPRWNWEHQHYTRSQHHCACTGMEESDIQQGSIGFWTFSLVEIFIVARVNYDVACAMDFHFYPHDVQTCPVRFTLWGREKNLPHLIPLL